jgi:hypothetical protein
MATSDKQPRSSTAGRYGKSLVLGGLIAIVASTFFLGTKDLATGIRFGGGILVVIGALISIFSRASSLRAQ